MSTTTLVLARYLGAEALGVYAAAVAYATVVGWIGGFGIDQVSTRDMALDRHRAGEIAGASILLTSVLTAVAVVVAIAAAPLVGFDHPQFRPVVLLALADVLVTVPLRSAGVVFRADMREHKVVFVQVGRHFVWLAGVLALVAAEASLVTIVAARLAVSVGEAALTLAMSWSAVGGLRPPGRGMTKGLLSASLPLGLALIAGGLMLRLDHLLLLGFDGPDAVGPYVAALRIAELPMMIAGALTLSVSPVLARAREDPRRLDAVLRDTSRLLLVTLIGVSVVVAAAPRETVVWAFGSAFASSGPLLAVLIWSRVPAAVAGLLAAAAVAGGRERWVLVSVVAGAAVNAVLNVVLIPLFGGAGAAVAAFGGYASGLVAYVAEPRSRRWLGHCVGASWRAAILAPAVVVAVRALGLSPGGRVVMSAVAYAAVLAITRTVTRADLRRMMEIVRRLGASGAGSRS